MRANRKRPVCFAARAMQAAMQRIAELEAMVKSAELGALRSPVRPLASSSCFDGGLRWAGWRAFVFCSARTSLD